MANTRGRSRRAGADTHLREAEEGAPALPLVPQPANHQTAGLRAGAAAPRLPEPSTSSELRGRAERPRAARSRRPRPVRSPGSCAGAPAAATWPHVSLWLERHVCGSWEGVRRKPGFFRVRLNCLELIFHGFLKFRLNCCGTTVSIKSNWPLVYLNYEKETFSWQSLAFFLGLCYLQP